MKKIEKLKQEIVEPLKKVEKQKPDATKAEIIDKQNELIEAVNELIVKARFTKTG